MIERRALERGTAEVAGQATVVAAVDQQCQLAVEQVSQVGDRRLEAIHHHRHMATVEVAAVENLAGLDIDQRIVVGAVELRLQEAAPPAEAVLDHADDVGRAARRVAVLQTRRVDWRGVDFRRRRVGQIIAQPLGHAGLTGMRLGGEQIGIEVVGVAFQRLHAEGGDARAQAAEIVGAAIGQRGEGRHHGGAVHQCQTFLGAQHIGRQAVCREDLRRRAQRVGLACAGAHPDLTLATQHGGHIGQRGEVAAGTHRAFLGNARQDVVIEQPHEALQQRHADPGDTTAQRDEAHHHHRATADHIQVRAHATAVEGIEMARQGFEVLCPLHGTRHGIAVTGGDAVDHAFFFQQAFQQGRAGLDTGAEGGIRSQAHLTAAFGDIDQLLEGDITAVENQGGGRGGGL